MKKILSTLMAGFVLFSSIASADVSVRIDNKPIYFDVQPQIINSRTMVPFRGIFEAMNATVDWDGDNRIVHAMLNDTQILLQIDNPVITVNNIKKQIDTPPIIIDGRTFIPLRAVSQAFNMKVNWNPDTYTADIYTASSSEQSIEKEVLNLVNQYRAEAGLDALVWDDDLALVAENHSKDMVLRNFFDHTNPDGKSPFDRMYDYGITYMRAAENIAAGQKTPESVMNSWMNSPGHRANILDPDLRKLGVGKASGGAYGIYWTQCFTD